MNLIESNHQPHSNNIMSNNEIIFIFKNIAIVQNEWGNLFHCTIPAEFVDIGDVVPTSTLQPLDTLSSQEQNAIHAIMGGDV